MRQLTADELPRWIRWFWCALVLLIVVQAVLWTVDGSGVARIRFFFQYPEGFNYIIDDPVVGRFLIQREDIRYITQYFSFLGNDAFGISRDWPAQRNLYSLLVSGLWPIGFVIGGAAINVVFWIGAAAGAWKMTELVAIRSPLGRSAAVALVVFHQGFLWSVGETNPHAAGYASGFLILGVMAHQRVLESDSSVRDLIPVAAVVGILCLVYHSALLYLPMFFLVALRATVQAVRGEQRDSRVWLLRASEIAILIALALGPMLLFNEVLMRLGLLTRGSSTGGVLYLQMLPEYLQQTPDAWLRAAYGFVAGFNAFGPLLLFPALLGSLLCLRGPDLRRRLLVVYFLGSMVFLTPNFLLGDPGYASVHLVPLAVLLAVVGLDRVWVIVQRQANMAARLGAALYVAGLAAYANAPLVGVPFPLNIGWSGYYCFFDCPLSKYRGNLYYYEEGHF